MQPYYYSLMTAQIFHSVRCRFTLYCTQCFPHKTLEFFHSANISVKQNQMSDNVPIDIQETIIKRLSLKPLIQCRSVSKTWKSLIDVTFPNITPETNTSCRIIYLSGMTSTASFVSEDMFQLLMMIMTPSPTREFLLPSPR